jgi:hypothetical protein
VDPCAWHGLKRAPVHGQGVAYRLPMRWFSDGTETRIASFYRTTASEGRSMICTTLTNVQAVSAIQGYRAGSSLTDGATGFANRTDSGQPAMSGCYHRNGKQALE